MMRVLLSFGLNVMSAPDHQSFGLRIAPELYRLHRHRWLHYQMTAFPFDCSAP